MLEERTSASSQAIFLHENCLGEHSYLTDSAVPYRVLVHTEQQANKAIPPRIIHVGKLLEGGMAGTLLPPLCHSETPLFKKNKFPATAKISVTE